LANIDFNSLKKNHTTINRFVQSSKKNEIKTSLQRNQQMKQLLKKIAIFCGTVSFFMNTSAKAQITKPQSTSNTTYTIDGFAHGFPDSTSLYLESFRPSLPKDSCKIIKGKFSLQLKAAANQAHYVVIGTKDFKDHKFFWIENSKTHISGLKGNFTNALIHNSPAQDIFEEYLQQKTPLYTEIDSLRRIVGIDDPAAVKRIEILEKDILQRTKKIITKYPNAIVSAYLLWQSHVYWGKKTSADIYGLLQKSKNSEYAKEVKQFIDLNKDIQIGDAFTDIQQKSPDGKSVSLSQYKGKWILLEFWASWCGPCRKDNPDLVKTYQTYKDKGFEIVAVSVDSNKDQWVQAIQKDQLPWIHMSDLKGNMNTASLIYGVFGIPDNFLINPEGKIIARSLRGGSLNKKLREIFISQKP